ncbi:MAG TPA: hypothetical protein VGN72_03865 [Tepidisphaeraceae bacterium]|jgi:autotransporter-associated beta strand protein|nr:hypothetical protein [Tepidisphaeraceae bacterium]
MHMSQNGHSGRAARLAIAAAAAVALSAFITPTVRAATWTWATAGTGNQSWNNSGNWASGTVPLSAADTTLVFGSASGSYTAVQDIVAGAAGFNLNLLQLTGTGSTPTLAISTGRLNFISNGAVGPRIEQNGTRPFNISPNINLAADTTLTLAGSGSGLVTIQGQFYGGAGATIEIASTGSTEYVLGSSTASASTAAIALNGGAVVLGSDNQPSGLLSLNLGKIGTSSSGSRTVGNAVSLGGNVTMGRSNAFALNFTNAATIAGTGATRQITLGASTAGTVAAAFQNTIGDGGNGNGLTIAGTGVLVLGNADANANTYTGATTVSGSSTTLRLNKAAGTDAVRGDLSLTNGTIAWLAGNQVNDASAITMSGGTMAVDFNETVAALSTTGGAFSVAEGATLSAGAVSLGGTPGGSNYAVPGTLAVGTGGLTITQPTRTDGGQVSMLSLTNASNASGTLRLSGDLTLTATSGSNASTLIRRGISNGAIDVNGGVRTFSVADTGANDDLIISANLTDSGVEGGLIKAGTGTLLLSNSSSANFNRAVAVNGGRLLLSSSSLGGTIAVNNNGTLGGNSSAVGAVTLNGGGTLDAGTTAGGTGTLTLASLGTNGGTVRFDVASASIYDVLLSNGSVDIGNGLTTLDIAADASYLPTVADRLWLMRVADAAGPVNGYFAGLTNGSELTVNGQQAWIYYDANFTTGDLTGGNDVLLSFTAAAVPEPTAVVSGLAASLMFLARRRRGVGH